MIRAYTIGRPAPAKKEFPKLMIGRPDGYAPGQIILALGPDSDLHPGGHAVILRDDRDYSRYEGRYTTGMGGFSDFEDLSEPVTLENA